MKNMSTYLFTKERKCTEVLLSQGAMYQSEVTSQTGDWFPKVITQTGKVLRLHFRKIKWRKEKQSTSNLFRLYGKMATQKKNKSVTLGLIRKNFKNVRETAEPETDGEK